MTEQDAVEMISVFRWKWLWAFTW